MATHQLAQLNIARLLEPLESPRLADFVANLERINALAEESPGFVWRLQSDEGDATSLRPFGEEWLVNMSLWQDVESLHQFVYRSAHSQIMRRRKEWFSRLTDAVTVLWWIPAGELPSVHDAKDRLDRLRQRGATAEAFTFAEAYPPPSSELPADRAAP